MFLHATAPKLRNAPSVPFSKTKKSDPRLSNYLPACKKRSHTRSTSKEEHSRIIMSQRLATLSCLSVLTRDFSQRKSSLPRSIKAITSESSASATAINSTSIYVMCVKVDAIHPCGLSRTLICFILRIKTMRISSTCKKSANKLKCKYTSEIFKFSPS